MGIYVKEQGQVWSHKKIAGNPIGDAALSLTSSNNIQNKVATAKFNEIDASIGDTDISDIGDGTVTGAIEEIDGKLKKAIIDGTVVTNSVNHATETEIRYATIAEAGIYLINVNVAFVNAFVALGQFNLHSPAYGNMLKISSDSMSNGRMLNGTLIKYLAANTRLSLRCYQTSNATQTIDTTYVSFKIKRLDN